MWTKKETYFQLLDTGDTKPIEVENLPKPEKTEIESQLECIADGTAGERKNGGAKRMLKKNRDSTRSSRCHTR